MQKAPDADAQAWVQKNLTSWSKATQKLAAQLVVKYGKPGDVTSRQLAWHDNGPWKRTVLSIAISCRRMSITRNSSAASRPATLIRIPTGSDSSLRQIPRIRVS